MLLRNDYMLGLKFDMPFFNLHLIPTTKKYYPTTSPSSPNSISNNHPIVEEKATANIDEVNHVNQIKTETKLTVIKSEQKSSLLTTSPFNTVSPPNKTVSDTYDSAASAASIVASSDMMDDSQFDEALILAAATASEEDITNLVTPLLS